MADHGMCKNSKTEVAGDTVESKSVARLFCNICAFIIQTLPHKRIIS